MPGDAQRLSCMEVWGGNEATDALVRTSGLDAHAYSLPHGGDANGGDVLHVTACSSGRITRALLADVVGHGQGAAEAAQSLRRLMSRSVNILDQGKLVRTLNDGFSELQEQGRFASAIVASYFRPTGALTICNAGHPPPLFYREREQAWSFLELGSRGASCAAQPVNLPLGLFGSVHYDLQELHLEAGDLVLLYTDGVIEAADAEDNQFGFDRLLDLVNDLEVHGVAEIIPQILGAMDLWTGTTALDDDVSLMIFGRNGLKTSLRDEAMAPVRFLRHRFGRS